MEGRGNWKWLRNENLKSLKFMSPLFIWNNNINLLVLRIKGAFSIPEGKICLYMLMNANLLGIWQWIYRAGFSEVIRAPK